MVDLGAMKSNEEKSVTISLPDASQYWIKYGWAYKPGTTAVYPIPSVGNEWINALIGYNSSCIIQNAGDWNGYYAKVLIAYKL